MSAPTATEVAQKFFDALAAMDVAAAVACFAPDGVQEMPFAPPGFPSRLVGVADLERQYGGLPDAYTSMAFDVTAIHPMADPQWVLLEYRGSIEQRDGSRYDNTYAGLFQVADGHIVLFREYFDPLVLTTAFGDRIDATFSLPTEADT